MRYKTNEMGVRHDTGTKRALSFRGSPLCSKHFHQDVTPLCQMRDLPPSLQASHMVQQMLGPLALAFLMEMATVVWLNDSDGWCVHACIMEQWRATLHVWSFYVNH